MSMECLARGRNLVPPARAVTSGQHAYLPSLPASWGSNEVMSA